MNERMLPVKAIPTKAPIVIDYASAAGAAAVGAGSSALGWWTDVADLVLIGTGALANIGALVLVLIRIRRALKEKKRWPRH